MPEPEIRNQAPSLFWVFPHPIALFFIKQGSAWETAVVGLVPSYRIKNELAVSGFVVMVWLAAARIGGQRADEARHEGLQFFGELTRRQPAPFQSAGKGGLVSRHLSQRDFGGEFAKRGQ